MDAREQVPLAPFGFGRARRELAAHDVAFAFERGERDVDVRLSADAERCGEIGGAHRAEAGQARADDFDERLVGRPFGRREFGRRVDRAERARRPDGSRRIAASRSAATQADRLFSSFRRRPESSSSPCRDRQLDPGLRRATTMSDVSHATRRARELHVEQILTSRDSAQPRSPSRTQASSTHRASRPALRASGHASSRTPSIASMSSCPKSAAVAGSTQRRLVTACVRRSSSGASSRYAYGRALSTSAASGDGAVRSRATMRTSPDSSARSRRSRPSMSIASCRQS